MRFFRRSLTGLFLLAVTVAVLALAGQMLRSAIEERMARETRSMPSRERVFAVNAVTITPEEVVPMLEAFGEVRSRRALEIRVQTGGRVIDLADGFEEGGRVEAGQMLLRVDPTDLEDALALARTDLAEAEAERADAKAALEIARDDLDSAERQAALREQALARQRDLAERGVVTEATVEAAALQAATAGQGVLSKRSALANAGARVAQAENTLARRKIALDEAARRLAETEITAAYSGVLSGVSVAEGRVVTANEQIATLIDPDALEVSFRVSTAQYARLIDQGGSLMRSDVTARLDVSGVDLIAEGRIDRESAEVGAGLTGRLLFARLDGARGFRPGDFVTVAVREPKLTGVAVLPATAVDAAGTVLVIGEGERLEVAPVEILRRQGDNVLVRAPDLHGRAVVAERSPVLGAGIRVRILTRGPDEAGAAAPPAEPEMIALDDDRRARLIAFVESNQSMPADAKERILTQLRASEVPAETIERLERRMGG